MAIELRVPTILRTYTGGEKAVNADGSFVIGNLTPGRYYLSAAVPYADSPGGRERPVPTYFPSAQREGLAFTGQPFTRYLKAGPGLLTIEAGLPIATEGKTAGEVEAIELPGGSAAVAIHRGPYDRLGETHAAVERWLDANKLEAAGAPWEVYVTDPGERPDPATWETEVIYPVR